MVMCMRKVEQKCYIAIAIFKQHPLCRITQNSVSWSQKHEIKLHLGKFNFQIQLGCISQVSDRTGLQTHSHLAGFISSTSWSCSVQLVQLLAVNLHEVIAAIQNSIRLPVYFFTYKKRKPEQSTISHCSCRTNMTEVGGIQFTQHVKADWITGETKNQQYGSIVVEGNRFDSILIFFFFFFILQHSWFSHFGLVQVQDHWLYAMIQLLFILILI